MSQRCVYVAHFDPLHFSVPRHLSCDSPNNRGASNICLVGENPTSCPSRHGGDSWVNGQTATAMHKLSTPPPPPPLRYLSFHRTKIFNTGWNQEQAWDDCTYSYGHDAEAAWESQQVEDRPEDHTPDVFQVCPRLTSTQAFPDQLRLRYSAAIHSYRNETSQGVGLRAFLLYVQSTCSPKFRPSFVLKTVFYAILRNPSPGT